MDIDRSTAETQLQIPVPGSEVVLDARLASPAHFETLAVLAHPHPRFGGTMDDRVVMGVRQICLEQGFAALRFNFRGVRQSTGRFGGGRAEVNDLRAVVDYSKNKLSAQRIVVIGYSFGGWVALASDLDVSDQVFLAPPNEVMDFSDLSFPSGSLAIAGDCDSYCDVEAMVAACRRDGAESFVVAGADHFFTHDLLPVARCLRERFASIGS